MVLWTPAHSTENPAVWLDAKDAGSFEIISSVVAEWRNQLADEHHAANSTAANRPARTETGFNGGYPAVDFAGTAKLLTIPRGFITNGFSLLIVHSGGSDNQRLVDQRSTGAAGAVKGWHVKNYRVVGDFAHADDGGGNYRGAQDGTAGGAAARISVTVFPESGELNWYLNGTQIVSRANGGSVPTDINSTWNIAIGGNADGSNTQDFTGLLAALALYPGAVSANEQRRLEGWAAHDNGLAGLLPSDHPYKSTAPMLRRRSPLLLMPW